MRPITTGLAFAYYCYSRHSLPVRAWPIERFWGCYRRHNLWFLMISLAGHFQIQTAGGRPRRVLLFAAQFGGAGFRHIPRLGCYSAHIFLFDGWVWPGLWGCVACWNRPHIFLQSAAPKAKGNCCYWRHNSQGSLFRTGLLLTTQLGVQQTAAAPLAGVVIRCTF